MIGAVGASATALGSMIIASPLGLILFDDLDAFTGALTLAVSGPIGIAIVHHFGFEMQMGIAQATKLSVVGFSVIGIGVSLIIVALLSFFRKL